MVVVWLGLLLLSSVSKHNIWTYYGLVSCCCCPFVNIICDRIMVGLSLLSPVSKTICGRIMVRVVVIVIGQ